MAKNIKMRNVISEKIKARRIARGLSQAEMAAQTALGAARMVLAGKGSPEELIAQVKSKGGTTEAALNIFAGRDLEGAVAGAVTAAAQRSRELSGNK